MRRKQDLRDRRPCRSQTGSKAVNTRLAEQRAKKVYDYLISKGVKAENLQYKGYSDTKSPFKTEQGNRVTVIR